MVMQGISPSGEKKIIDIASISDGADTTVCMLGGRFCVFTVVSDEKFSGNSVSLTLCCGGEDSRYIPETANKTVSLTTANTDKIASAAVDMGGFQTFKIKSITGSTDGKIIIEPMWC